MCYDVNYIFKQQLKRAKYHSNKKAITDIEDQVKDYFPKQVFHISGFTHPDMIIYTQEDPLWPKLSNWGFVPHWCKESGQADKLKNMCLNAVGETIFEKPAFRNSAREKRGIVLLNGFYEHHHFKNKTYPFFITGKGDTPFAVATLYDEWTDMDTGEIQHTFSIVTTAANPLMAKIHNKKKRMPLIIPNDMVNDWLSPINDKTGKELIVHIIHTTPSSEMKAHTIGRLRGANAIGNVPEVTTKVSYKDLPTTEITDVL